MHDTMPQADENWPVGRGTPQAFRIEVGDACEHSTAAAEAHPL
jgi:hypothetical protein